MKEFISYGKQWIDDDDVKAVVESLKSDYLTQGPKVVQFEKLIGEYVGARYCVAVSSATAALHLAVNVLEIESGMEGITSPNTFVASSNCLIYNNLKPVFADIDSDSYNIDHREIEKRICDKTKIIIPVHFAGRTCNMERIKEIANKNNSFVVEDAAHAIGSRDRDGEMVGNCKYSDMTVFSFHPVKSITSGEGGAITTNNVDVYNKLLSLRSHGIIKPEINSENEKTWYYAITSLGYNFRITDIQAALGISQLKKIDFFKQRRKSIVEKYNIAFAKLDWLRIPLEDEADSCFHLYVLLIDYDRIGKSRNEVMKILRMKNIGTQVHYIPVHTHSYYQMNYDYKWGDYPFAEDYYQKALSIPLYPKMTDENIEYVIDAIIKLGS